MPWQCGSLVKLLKKGKNNTVIKLRIFLCLLILFITGCSSIPDDVPPVEIESTPDTDGAPTQQRDVTSIPDAVPQEVVRTRAGNKSPYTVFGKTYYLLDSSEGYEEQGYASWYGTKFHGRRTANGEVYDMWAMTAAHKTLPIPSYVRVTNLDNGLTIVVKVNDRGPFHSDRIIDLSYGAAQKLDFAEKGVARVHVVDVTPAQGSQKQITTSAKPDSVENVELVAVEPVTSVDVPSKTVPSNSEPDTTAKQTDNVVSEKQNFDPVTLQVGAFKVKQSADTLKDKLLALLKVPVNVISDQQWSRVRVGPIVSPDVLDQVKKQLVKFGISRPQIVKP